MQKRYCYAEIDNGVICKIYSSYRTARFICGKNARFLRLPFKYYLSQEVYFALLDFGYDNYTLRTNGLILNGKIDLDKITKLPRYENKLALFLSKFNKAIVR